jgi:hypothetical protein
MLLLLRFIARTVLLGLVTRLLGAFFPVLRRLVRLVWR